MKRYILLLCFLIMTSGLIAGCGSADANEEEEPDPPVEQPEDLPDPPGRPE